MNLYITVCKSVNECDSFKSFEKTVAWPCCPPEGSIIFVGKDDEGDRSCINATVSNIGFYSDGEITVEAVIKNCREEFISICQAIERDGFLLIREKL